MRAAVPGADEELRRAGLGHHTTGWRVTRGAVDRERVAVVDGVFRVPHRDGCRCADRDRPATMVTDRRLDAFGALGSVVLAEVCARLGRAGQGVLTFTRRWVDEAGSGRGHDVLVRSCELDVVVGVVTVVWAAVGRGFAALMVEAAEVA